METSHAGPSERTFTALSVAVRGIAERSVELEAALCEYVAYLKASGMTAETVVITIKQVLTDSGLRGRDSLLPGLFVDGVVTLCINQFYSD